MVAGQTTTTFAFATNKFNDFGNWKKRSWAELGIKIYLHQFRIE